MLTKSELERYDRQIMIADIGKKGQEKLKRTRVCIAGTGGLGSAVAIYLTASGIGKIRLVDNDRVDITNLNRQVLYGEKDIGKKKVSSASKKLRKINHEVHVEAIEETINETNVFQLISNVDVIVDAMDNLPTRYLLNRAAIENKIPFFHGAVYGFEGRTTTIIPDQTACLRCLYKGDIPKEKIPVIGVTPAIIGCIQATEVIKYIVGIGELLKNRLLIYDGLDMQFTTFTIKKDPQCDHCGHLKKE